jgi:hypothetical protein
VKAETAFQLLNLAVLPVWATWIAAPRSRLAARLARNGVVLLLLCLLYAGLLAGALGGVAGGFDFAGLRAGLSTPVGFLAGWTHWLVFDLFVGGWIVRESQRIAIEPRLFLVLTLLAGPFGLGSFLLRRAARLRTLGQIGEVDLV